MLNQTDSYFPPVLLVLAALVVAALPAVAAPAPGVTPLDPARVKAVAAMLPEKPTGLGQPVSNRAFWDTLAAQPHYQDVVKRADLLLSQPLPDLPDELYREFSRTGQRTDWQRVSSARRSRLAPLVLAECAQNKGRFLPAVEQLIEAVCAERTWVLPATDEKLANFNGEIIEIDLLSSLLGWDLALADYLLGERLRPVVRKTLRANVKRRVLDPFRTMIRGQSEPVFIHGQKAPSRAMFWLTATHNWNAVCLAGVTGAALTQITSRDERAEFVVAAETYSRFFLAGFTSDGYCSEGLGYWGYGFGRYVLLSEAVRQATKGGVDLLAIPEARRPATYPARIQIIGGIAPAFADCTVFARPSPVILFLLNRRLRLGLTQFGPETTRQIFPTLFETMILGNETPESATVMALAASAPALRDWFDQAGVLVARPAPGSASRLGVALKGGHNAEHHNHNDVGSYVVVSGARPVLLDPGLETYTARTFSSRRYESKLLNSFGHPVPVVAGTLQSVGRQAHARVLRTDFSNAADTLALDLTSAYAVPDLISLRRTFVYSRKGAGSLTVTDRVEMKTPQAFGTTVLTLGSWERQADNSLLIQDGEEALRVEVNTGGRAFAIDAQQIRENAPVSPTRLGINLQEPVTTAVITLTITPALGRAGERTTKP